MLQGSGWRQRRARRRSTTTTGREVEANGINYPLIPLRQGHDRSVAPDVHAIEEAHSEQGDGQAVALRDDCVDVMHGDLAKAYRVELETISEHIAVGGLHHGLLPVAVVEPESARLAG